NPVAPPVPLPSMMNRGIALLPLIAATVLGDEVISVGRSGCPMATLAAGVVPPVSELVTVSGGSVRAAYWPVKEILMELAGNWGPPETKTLPVPKMSLRAARTWAELALNGIGAVVRTGRGAEVVRVNVPPVGSPAMERI